MRRRRKKATSFVSTDGKSVPFLHILAQGGLDDDFYGTGKVTNLQPADLHNRVYCYVKQQTGPHNTFPQAETDGNPVLYFVTMKA